MYKKAKKMTINSCVLFTDRWFAREFRRPKLDWSRGTRNFSCDIQNSPDWHTAIHEGSFHMKFPFQILQYSYPTKYKFQCEVLKKIMFNLQCVIAQGYAGIMVLLKRSYLIDIIDDNRDQKVKVSVRFFNVEDRVIHTTDKTEIEISFTVNISFVTQRSPIQPIRKAQGQLFKCQHYFPLRTYQM